MICIIKKQYNHDQLMTTDLNVDYFNRSELKVENGWETLNRREDGSLRGDDGKVGIDYEDDDDDDDDQ